MNDQNEQTDLLMSHATDIVAAFVAKNSLRADELPSLIQKVFTSLSSLGQPITVEEERPEPAVSIRSSVKNDHIVCLEDGKKMKMLKRHLMTDHGLTPDAYRGRWGLSSDYPMVAPDYAEKRRELAKLIGLGRNPGQRSGRPKSPQQGA